MFNHLGWGEYNQKETCKISFSLLVGASFGTVCVPMRTVDEPTLTFLVLVCSFPIMSNSVKL